MKRQRVEAFSDGVLAIVITIMVLELKVPHEATWMAFWEQWPHFLSYLLSFVYIAIYWNNHHHLMHTVSVVNGKVLWANNHLLFWLSLVPFATAWMGEKTFAQVPVVLYSFVLMMAAVAYFLFVVSIISASPENAVLQRATKGMTKELLSLALYLAAIVSGVFFPGVALLLNGIVAVLWIIPDSRIEKVLVAKEP